MAKRRQVQAQTKEDTPAKRAKKAPTKPKPPQNPPAKRRKNQPAKRTKKPPAKRKNTQKPPAKRRSRKPPPPALKRSNLGKYLLKFVFPNPHRQPSFARKPSRLHRFCVKHTGALLKDAAGHDPHRMHTLISDSDFRKVGIQRRERGQEIDLDAVLAASLAAMPTMPKSKLHKCGKCSGFDVSYKQNVRLHSYRRVTSPYVLLTPLWCAAHRMQCRSADEGNRTPPVNVFNFKSSELTLVCVLCTQPCEVGLTPTRSVKLI